MAAAATLIPGARYPVRAGEFEGQLVEIVSNVTEPDDSPLRRRIPVRIVRNGVAEEQVYILPRLIHDGNLTPKKMAEQAAAAMANAAPGQAPVIVPIPTNHQENHTVPTATAAPASTSAPVLPPLPPLPTVVHTEVTVAPTLVANNPITDIMDPRLDAYRPDRSVVERYIHRTFPGGKLDSDVLLGYWKKRQNVLFVGDTQAGKSMFIQVLACLVADLEGYPKPLPIFTLSGSSGVTDFDMFGQITSYADPTTHAERLVQLDGVVEIAATVGGILELDEVAMLPERVTSSLHPLCDDRRQFVNRGKAVQVEGDGFMPKITKASPNLWILGAYNDGYRGSGQLQEAFLNRFKHIQWGYEEAIEKQLVASPVIRRMGVTLRAAYETKAISTPIGTKALEGFTATFFEHGPEYALWEFLGMFPGKDRARAEAILEQNTLVKYLADEWEQRNEDAPDLTGVAADPFD